MHVVKDTSDSEVDMSLDSSFTPRLGDSQILKQTRPTSKRKRQASVHINKKGPGKKHGRALGQGSVPVIAASGNEVEETSAEGASRETDVSIDDMYVLDSDEDSQHLYTYTKTSMQSRFSDRLNHGYLSPELVATDNQKTNRNLIRDIKLHNDRFV